MSNKRMKQKLFYEKQSKISSKGGDEPE